MTKEKQGRASALPCFFMPDLPNKTAVIWCGRIFSRIFTG